MIVKLKEELRKGNYRQSLNEIDNLRKKDELNDDLNLIEAEILLNLAKYAEAIEVLNNLIERKNTIDLKYVIKAKILLIEVHRKQGNIIIEGEEYNSIEEIIQSLNINENEKLAMISDLHFTTGNCKLFKGDLDLSGSHFSMALKYAMELNDNFRVSNILNNMGIVKYDRGDLKDSLDLLNKALQTRKSYGNKILMAQTMNNIGIIYDDMGKVHDAEKYYLDTLSIYEELNIPIHIASANNNLGEIYRIKGETDKALEHYLISKDLFEQQKNDHFIGISYHNIGRVFQDKGQIELAKKYFKIAQEIREKIGHDNFIVETYFQLLLVYIAENKDQESEEILKKFEKLAVNIDNKRIILYWKLGKALYLKSKPSLKKRMESQTILEQIVEEDVFDHQLNALSLLHLIDLLIDELKLYRQKNILAQINKHLTKLYDIAQQQYNIKLIIEVLILRSRIKIIDGNLSEAEHLLKQAEIFADEHQLHQLLNQIAEEFINFVNYWKINPQLSTSSDIFNKLNKLEIEYYIDYLKKNVNLST